MKPKVLVVAVSYRSSTELPRFLGSIPSEGIDIIIVDNSVQSSEYQACVDAATLRNARVVGPDVNLGYFGSLKYVGGSDDLQQYEWVILTNVDVEFDRDFFHVLQRQNYSEVGVLGPNILDFGSGRRLNPYMLARPSQRKMALLVHLFRFITIARVWVFVRSLRKARPSQAVTSRRVYATHGSIIVMSRSYFRIPDALQYPSFLFGEEVFVGETCQRNGLPVTIVPELRATHFGHVSTGGRSLPGVWRSRQMLLWQRESVLQLKHLLQRDRQSR